jgi:hypothetical protein
MVSYCSAGQCLATENCPESSVVQRSALDLDRVDYGSGIVAEDNAYLLSTLRRAAQGEDGSSGCPVHGEGYTEPEPGNDEENGDEPEEPGGTSVLPITPSAPITPSTPSESNEPDEPEEPDGTDTGGDWFDTFWSNQ